MKTVIIQIGNSDDKLKQSEWNEFVVLTRKEILKKCGQIHFFGGPMNYEKWQNVCSVFEISEKKIEDLKKNLQNLGSKFKQDSIAWTQGITEFLPPISV
jgi:hypothetical protein